LLERIARREGAFADMLAGGIKHAAETLGEEAKNCAVYTMKGHAPRGHDHRAFWREMFDTATSDVGTYSSGYLGPADPDTHSLKAKFSPEEVSTHIAKTKGRRQFEDMLGTCSFCVRAPLRFLVDALNAVTGWDFTIQEAQDAGLRVANLMRAFNLQHGVGADLERPSPRWSSTPVDGPAKGISIKPHWDGMMDNYYQLMGWDRQTGKPFPETLRALGLDSVVADLCRMRFLTLQYQKRRIMAPVVDIIKRIKCLSIIYCYIGKESGAFYATFYRNAGVMVGK
jgi:aldehyde:ferredoxin oxidoreductase